MVKTHHVNMLTHDYYYYYYQLYLLRIMIINFRIISLKCKYILGTTSCESSLIIQGKLSARGRKRHVCVSLPKECVSVKASIWNQIFVLQVYSVHKNLGICLNSYTVQKVHLCATKKNPFAKLQDCSAIPPLFLFTALGAFH